jgi:hypothetical protein
MFYIMFNIYIFNLLKEPLAINSTPTILFGNEWHIFDKETHQLSYSIYYIDKKMFRIKSNIKWA